MTNKKVLFAVGAGVGGLLSAVLLTSFGLGDSAFSSWVFSGALDAALIGTGLAYAQNYYQSHEWTNRTKIFNGLTKGLMIGAAGGFAALIFVNFFGGGFWPRLIGWGISGGVAGYVASLRVPNLKKNIAISAGCVGAVLGFFIMYLGLSYTLGVAVTGVSIGLMVAFSEELFREMSIDVILKPQQTGVCLTKPYSFNLTLGATPLTVGYSSEMDINLRASIDISVKHAANIYLESGKVIFHEVASNIKNEINPNQVFNYKEAEIKLKLS